MSLGPGFWPWLAILLLGIYHGINPAMGWLFAVAWGLQERRTSAVLVALGPIVLGHAASVALVVALVSVTQVIIEPRLIRWVGAIVLILFGVYRVLRPRAHLRGAGMRVGFADLVLWSFVMSTAHGAGLMLFPILLGMATTSSAHDHGLSGSVPEAVPFVEGVAVVALHSLAMFAAMAAVSLIVYVWLGVAILRRVWANMDLFWAIALILAGVLTLLV